MKRICFLCICILLLTALPCLTACRDGGDETPTAPTDTSASDTPTQAPTDVNEATEAVTGPDSEAETQPEAAVCVIAAVYPTPKEMSAAPGDSVTAVPCPALAPVGDTAGGYVDVLTALGLPAGDSGLPLTVTLGDLSGQFDTCPDEGYVLSVTPDGVTVTAGSDRGAFYALCTLSQLYADGVLPVVTVTDAPVMPVRGVIEGFYGVAWTHEYRLDLFAFMGRNKMNTYMYAPKDDPKHRSEWRASYTGKELKRMRELIDTAAENRVKFVYAISPGLDMDLGTRYEKDFEALCKKCESMYELGVRDFAILLDDIPTLNAEGHAKLLNDFEERFVGTHEGVSDLIAITPEFCDAMLTGYTDAFAPLLDPDIELMWTGTGVLSADIRPSNLKKINGLYGRRVLIWWNYPVNDGQPDNLFMDAARGLSADLDESVTGLLSNPMNQGYASLIPLFTTADYLWNPTAYRADASLAAAEKALYPGIADELHRFIDLTGASPMNGQKNSTALARLIDAYKRKPDAGNADALRASLEELVTSADAIRAGGYPRLVTEISPWLDKMSAMASAGIAFLDMQSAGSGNVGALLEKLDAYLDAQASIAQNTRSVSPSALTAWIPTLGGKINGLFGFEGSGSASGIGLSTDMPTYETYTIGCASDGADSTFFWSAGAPNPGNYLQIDLGTVQKVEEIRLKSGVGGHNDDYMHDAELMYSTDGKAWMSICKVTSPSLTKQVSISARYIRLICRAAQIYWVTVSDFSARCAESGGGIVTTDMPFVQPYDLLALTDGSVMSVFSPDPAKAAGHTLTVDVSGCASLHVLFVKLPAQGGLTVQVLDASGKVLASPGPAREMIVDCAGAARVVMTFGTEAVGIAEIVPE
ncbi:MAG: beta-N-acetylglucosaminidase domain-containing protein [Clostridia bacterium]|nr:beta-N-acetylglucosaminidase domain-containing protein [Clostridia bacterium]